MYEKTKEEKLAQEIENAINSFSFDEKKFAEAFKSFHPTLQQKFYRIIREVVNVQADSNRIFDDRNKASHEISIEMKKIFEKKSLPFI